VRPIHKNTFVGIIESNASNRLVTFLILTVIFFLIFSLGTTMLHNYNNKQIVLTTTTTIPLLLELKSGIADEAPVKKSHTHNPSPHFLLLHRACNTSYILANNSIDCY
jgi:hypothetical protein